MNISVIISTRNRCEFLKAAVKNVKIQKEVNLEIIIINDCSSDDTDSYVQSLSDVIYIKNEINLGLGKSHQLGFNRATGDYIVFLDDDDYYTDQYFFCHAGEKFEEIPELSFVSGNAKIGYSDGTLKDNNYKMKGYVDGKDFLCGFQKKYSKPLSTFTTVFKKEKLDQAGFKTMKMMNDISIYLRASTVGSAYFLSDVIGVYYIHDSNMTKNINYDFLIDNLNEKVSIYENYKGIRCQIKRKLLVDRQILTTFIYYIGENSSKGYAYKKAVYWFNINHRYLELIYISCYYMYCSIRTKL